MLFYAGQILNRLSTDLSSVDKILPNIFMDSIQVTIFFYLNKKCFVFIYLFIFNRLLCLFRELYLSLH